MCNFSGHRQFKGFTSRPPGGKLPLPTPDLVHGQLSLRELHSRTQPLTCQTLMHIVLLASWVLLSEWVLGRSSPGTSAKASFGGGGMTLQLTLTLYPVYFLTPIPSLRPHPESPRGYKIPSTVRCI